MTGEPIAAVLGSVRDRIVSESIAKGADVSGWFNSNAARLLALAKLLEALTQRSAAGGLGPRDSAAKALAEAEALVARRDPAQGAWFSRNRKFLNLVAVSLVTQRHSRPAPSTTTAPSSPDRPAKEQPEPELSAPELSSGARETAAEGTGQETPNSQAEVPEATDQGQPDESDPRKAAERTSANVEALQILARIAATGRQATPAEIARLRRYSGLGGLSLKGVVDKIPPDWVPEERGLIHEYYTPTVVARAIGQALRPRLASIRSPDGKIEALEPSAGIGRLIGGLTGDGFDGITWHAVEYSRVSAALLKATRPDIDVFQGPFEQWVDENPDLEGRINLVVSNPPYGERGKAQYLDPDKAYRVRRAYVYQMLRGTDYLAADGIGVFLVPAGFMTGTSADAVATRRRVLLRNHLMAAFRLPSETETGRPLFPGALLVVDLIFLRSRGGSLAEVAESDQSIVSGNYFRDFPSHILGTESGKEAGEDEVTKKPRFGYQVRGTFEVLPEFAERPFCRECIASAIKRRPPKRVAAQLPEPIREAVQLARLVSRYLADVAKNEPESIKRAAAAQPELKAALLAWDAQPEAEKLAVAAAIRVAPELQALFTVLQPGGVLLQSLDQAPSVEQRFLGDPDDLPAIASYLHGRTQAATISAITQLHREIGGQQQAEDIKTALIKADFAFEGDRAIPSSEYYTGLLWPKYDTAKAAGESDPLAATQARRLLELIKPVSYAEIAVEPRLGWLPVAVLARFFSHYLNRTKNDSATYSLTRQGPILTLAGVQYSDVALQLSREAVELLGYLNHDMIYFRPKVKRDSQDEADLEKVRLRLAAQYKEAFVNWLETVPELQREISEAFNRLFRGWVEPSYSTAKLPLFRWNPDYPLYPYQSAGARRLLVNHGGGLFFDVGLGKTRTMLAVLAGARQEGWARRAVVVMPNSVTFNWLAEIERVLPDYRVVLIGVKRKAIQRGERKGQIESETDTPAERAAKWQRFKAGLYDVALVTYSALSRTRMHEESLKSIVMNTPAMLREIGFKVRDLEARIGQLKKKQFKLSEKEREELEQLAQKYGSLKVSERREAVQNEELAAFVGGLVELPAGQEYDPGIDWEDLGIDWLAFDEAHTGKNLWTIGAREGGVPKFLGAPQEGSAIAYQMFFRSALVRKRTGGTGIFLADATPAKNSPLEFLSLLSFLDDNVWARLGIFDAEQYLTQYLRIEVQLILNSDLTPAELPCVVGFKNLDQLREVLFRYGEFQTAKAVGLKIPEPVVTRLEVDLDEAQEEKYRTYLKQYSTALSASGHDPDARFAALGLLQKMTLVAVHSELDQGPWSFANAGSAASYASPKIDKIAELIAQRRDCGHLVFFENNAVHYWLRERLVAAGVERDRIAVLNGETAGNSLVRQRIAEGFTSDSAKYDVVIANKIAYEGLNLQNRTCAIYHGDLPWEPATLQQRNGRGLRQGNRYDVIMIYYILSKRSMDMGRFQLIQGKREWLSEVVESAASEANNPAAQATMSPEDWLIYLSRDQAATQKLIDDKRAAQVIAENQRLAKLAWANVRGIAMRHRDMLGADLLLRTQLTAGIGELADELNKIDQQVWPWRFMVPYLLVNPVLSFAPSHEGAIWETARYLRRSFSGEIIDGAEFGRVLYDPLSIGYRQRGKASWEALSLSAAHDKWELTRPDDWQQVWVEPLVDEVRDSMDRMLRRLGASGVYVYREFRFDLATEEFREVIWKEWGLAIVDAIARSSYNYQARVPYLANGVLSASGESLGLASTVFPFTSGGYQKFLLTAQAGALKWTELDAIAEWWWGRGIPRNLLAPAKEKLAA